MSGKRPSVAVIGMGGFAREHHRVVQALEQAGECRLACACDPQPEAFPEDVARWDFAGRDVRVFTDYRDLLDECGGHLDLVTIPTPIPLHAPMHRACVESGVAVYLEKPPTLDPAELDAMIATDARAAQSTAVGFLNVSDGERLALKRRIVAGELGRIERVSMTGLVHRSTWYYGRAPWAGRLILDGRIVADSCIGNAMAHSLHNLLLWAGDTAELSWADVRSVEAEMYHAHDIESADTVFARGRCANGVEVRVAASHACDKPGPVVETVECERAVLRWCPGGDWTIAWRDGRTETGPAAPGDRLTESIRHQLRCVRGEETRPLTTLPDTRPFVTFHSLALMAAGRVMAVAPEHVVRSQSPYPGDGIFAAIRGIREACDAMIETGRLPSEQGVPWARAGGAATVEQIGGFRGAIERMVAAA